MCRNSNTAQVLRKKYQHDDFIRSKRHRSTRGSTPTAYEYDEKFYPKARPLQIESYTLP